MELSLGVQREVAQKVLHHHFKSVSDFELKGVYFPQTKYKGKDPTLELLLTAASIVFTAGKSWRTKTEASSFLEAVREILKQDFESFCQSSAISNNIHLREFAAICNNPVFGLIDPSKRVRKASQEALKDI